MKHLNKQAVRQNKTCQHTSQSTDNRLYIGRGFAQAISSDRLYYLW